MSEDVVSELLARLGDLTLVDAHRLGRRLQRGTPDSRLLDDLLRAEARVARRRAGVPTITYPAGLPVSERRADLLEAIADNQVVVIAGETGSGKTTQLPKICLELGRGVRGAIAHTQPRRLAARTVAERIADELSVPLGGPVGYSVRFNDRAGEDTLVRLVTDGLLLAEVQHDRDLRRYDTIIVDEAHERSLNIDFLLGYLRRLLPRRPDLKLVITSATIDPGQFSRHFGDAPVVEVSGRTYPVEVRYRPLAPEGSAQTPEPVAADLPDAIADAVEELQLEARGDVLVFLSGEREIRDVAEVLTGRLGPDVDVLPLFARLSAPEQQRVFRPDGRRRVVLATNVAETSLTVPGIRYVVDPGDARISRYSSRLKVQRLPIEAISQASADQRKGRCGRTSDGICIRLYAEADFLARPRFTDPEILRTSLAAVILQMAALGLGEIEDFGFLDPPDGRQIRDGVALLHELGALDPEHPNPRKRLTELGRRLARLPVDPRMGRMVLEADKLDCAHEVCVIAAALSIQDVRERPAEKKAQADQAHARFSDEHSDFIAILNLWRHLSEQREELSGNQFRKRCKAEYLHYLRVREWQDLVGQLRSSAKQVGVTLNQVPGDPVHIHRALLSGLLSHVGVRDPAKREYLGARGARFAIFPGSTLARRGPNWVMAAELVETGRLWGRQAAKVEPRWIEPLAGHLVARSYTEPRWDRRRGSVVATERVSLYGLPVVAGRTVTYGAIDAPLSRALLIQRALVERDWDSAQPFFVENGRRISEVEALEERVRRRGLLVADDVLFDHLDARLPLTVVSAAHLERWLKGRPDRQEALTFPREILLAEPVDEDGRPDVWLQDDLELPLQYRFAPGTPEDGVTVRAPLAAVEHLRPERFEWLVPALRLELVTTLLRGLPKEHRVPLVPIPQTAAKLLARLAPGEERVLDALTRELRAAGIAVGPDDWDVERLPTHLRMHFVVEDEKGGVVAASSDLDALRDAVRPQLRARLAAATARLERTGMTSWELDALPKAVSLKGTSKAVRAFPALVDEGETVGVVALDSRAAQTEAMVAGTRRLLLRALPSPVRQVRAGLEMRAQLGLSASPHGSPGAFFADALAATVDALVASGGGPAWNAEAFAALQEHVGRRLLPGTQQVVRHAIAALDRAREVEVALDGLTAVAFQPARADVQAQVARLVYPGFITPTGAARLADVERYLHAALKRVQRLPDALGVDRDRIAEVHALEAEHRTALQTLPRGGGIPATLQEVPWLLEELRVAHFGAGLAVRGPVSAKKVRKALLV